MNERILKLLAQTDIPQFPILGSLAWVATDHDMEKFARLIVQECITIVDEQKECLHEEQKYWHDRDYGYASAVDDASKGIKQFFGVEE